MKTYITNATKRVNNYASKLKHPQTLKYVKGLSHVAKLSILIVLERLNNNMNGEVEAGVKFNKAELEAFEVNCPSDKNGAYVCVDLHVSNTTKPYIVVLKWF
jgi:hypothetical protein